MRGIGLTVHSPKIESVQSTEDIKDSLRFGREEWSFVYRLASIRELTDEV